MCNESENLLVFRWFVNQILYQTDETLDHFPVEPFKKNKIKGYCELNTAVSNRNEFGRNEFIIRHIPLDFVTNHRRIFACIQWLYNQRVLEMQQAEN